MLHRAAVLACLLAPLAAQAQTASITFAGPSTYGKADCVPGTTPPSTDDPAISMDWTVVLPSGAVPGNGWTWVVRALPPSGNCSSDSSTGTKLNQNTINYGTAPTGSFPGSTGETLHLSDLVTKSGLSCSATTDQVITVCVQLLNGTSVSTTVTNTITVQLGVPGPPTGVSVAPGDSALNVSWNAPTSTVKADRYLVTAKTIICDPIPAVLTASCLGAIVSQGTTTATSRRLTGLTNDVTYGVQVAAISVGGNQSVLSDPPVAGTPALVRDFWDEYKNAGGAEEGGCAGGPAGAVSLLAVAGLVRILRRRS